jgi:dCMP deaminase
MSTPKLRKTANAPFSSIHQLPLFSIDSEPMDKWDQRFCELAKFVSEWSKDPRARVGAVLNSKRGGDVSIGYNGFPMGVEDSAERLQNKAMKLELIVHAEQNAIIAAGTRSIGSTLYVWGKPICVRCAGTIIQAGVKRVVALSPETEKEGTIWRMSGELGLTILKESGIEVNFYTVENISSPASSTD